ncbi:uncharacterized protein [Physcomitrium patens]|uniref:5'-nucleotidase n=1 Tax=Physcomitrium patens TaxID=3218 RepID=A0A7I4AVA4_PHYPA|nr:5'-nucleotidase domain-containing protein 4-like isoform X3 [Physcomitrium patens]|eukprot:XP_024394455.1 5'-nucleotidase domain-containing protein 4-like isoform X3 [Physcomitrella patens]
MNFLRFSSASSASAGHQLQNSLLLGFAHGSCSTWSSSLGAPPFRVPRRRAWSGLKQASMFGCAWESQSWGMVPAANPWDYGVAVHSRRETRSASVSRSVGDAENFSGNWFAGKFRNLKSRSKWSLYASRVEPYSTNGADRSYEGVAAVDGELLWSGRWWARPIDARKQIFCNRSLNMKSIDAIGFDMDYTLAQYKPETFESLAYVGTIQKLVHNLNYPSELLQWKFDWRFMVRGLVLDKRRGCILKMDRHKYVKVAYHGFRELSRDDRQAMYGNTLSRESYDEPDYALIDTLFSLAEAYLFMQLVDFKDAFPDKMPSGAYDYSQLYKDVRSAVDLCHRDGTLKQAVANDPSKYINEDPLIIPMLKMLKQSGRKLFLVTNSLWDYTHVVMNFLCGKCGTEGGVPRDDEWLSYFDVVVTGSAKPTFFMDGNRTPLFEVDISTGMLQNTDSGVPMAQIGGVGLEGVVLPNATVKKAHRVFQGGSVAHLHNLLSIEASSQVLYVGDHIYGDILRSKKELGWRTMLVVPELAAELDVLHQTMTIRKEISELRTQRDDLEDSLLRLEWCLRHENHTDEDQQRLEQEVAHLRKENAIVREQHRQGQRECHHLFHKTWGQLMKTGYQNSRFSHQVERFACLYTSHVTNLCYYSPNKSYRTTEDFMPHELQGDRR